MQAIEILEDEGRGSTALDAFRQAIGLAACLSFQLGMCHSAVILSHVS